MQANTRDARDRAPEARKVASKTQPFPDVREVRPHFPLHNASLEDRTFKRRLPTPSCAPFSGTRPYLAKRKKTGLGIEVFFTLVQAKCQYDNVSQEKSLWKCEKSPK